MSTLSPLPCVPEELVRRLLAWYAACGRDLPWRASRDPYRIWLSEIMLQQTTVAAVVPYYQRFLHRFPTVQDLAEASLDSVIQLWSGLGYYSRARNLHRAARQLVNEYAGCFPDRLEELMALPGVGRSTAGAILSIAFDQPAPILDGNVRRVLVRLGAWQHDPRSSRAEKQLWAWAEQLTPAERPHDYAQAIMDLGATVCTPRDPACDRCPWSADCQALHRGLTDSLPVKRRRRPVPTRRQAAILVVCNGRLRVMQRPPEGLLGGLWEFPLVDVPDGRTADRALRTFLKHLTAPLQVEFIGEIRHIYSHFKLALSIYVSSVDHDGAVSRLPGRWCPTAEVAALPLHGAHLKALELFQRHAMSA